MPQFGAARNAELGQRIVAAVGDLQLSVAGQVQIGQLVVLAVQILKVCEPRNAL